MAQPKSTIESDIIWLLREFAVSTEHYVGQASTRYNVHRTDMNALNALVNAQHTGTATSASDLGRQLGLTPAATTALIDRLETGGLAQRCRSTCDRRQVHILLTDKAKDDGWVMFSPLIFRLSESIAQFSRKDQELAARFLAAAIDAVQSAIADEM